MRSLTRYMTLKTVGMLATLTQLYFHKLTSALKTAIDAVASKT